MDIHNLRAFARVADSGSFSRAAESLHLTQPAVSKRVALLEQHLDTVLFDRIGRQVTLTEAGQALLPHARAIELELRAAEQAVRDLSGDVAGRLRLATSHHIGLHRLPPVLSEFSNTAPAVHVDIDFMDSEQAYELISQGNAELAVVTLAPGGKSPLIARPIWHDELLFMVGRNHPLGARLTALYSEEPGTHGAGLAALSKFPAVLPGLGTYTGQIIKQLFDLHGLQLNVSLATNYLETIRMMATVGLGWTVLPQSMCDDSLQVFTIHNVTLSRNLGIVYHRDRSLSRAARLFIATLERFADQ
jgi:DNA-binding transcriptional LysR family regulator